ncbi:MAG: hypothetical protein OEZ09_07310 [Betaproteobacteria bacterium]|nr:hypothetical protein [Betaproteobacteria bacterium]MDH5578253.1 hypothetical protein [Betaproteobacteria bacterium]
MAQRAASRCARSRAGRRRQRGVALLAFLAIAVMVFAYVLTSRLNAASQFVGIDRDHNAKVLSQAKQALIGWMAMNAATDNNPGRLPCPEAVNAIGTNSEGISAPLISPATPNCATVGRLPWRTLGLNKLVDAASEPLWYAVSPGWALQISTTLLSINADSQGAMVIDGQAAPNEVVALIIAPGPAMNVMAAGGCTARTQARATPAPAMDPLDYIECFNAGTPSFSTTGPATSFNDQAVRITVADLMPALEAAIADRAQREIAPALRNAAFVLDSSWPRRWVTSSSNPPIYPYAAPFADPTTSNYRGAAGTYQGLAPFATSAGFVAYESTPANAVETMGNGTIESQTCSWVTANEVRECEGEYKEPSPDPTLPMRIEMTATFNNVAMGFRALDTTRLQAWARDNNAALPWNPLAVSYRAEMNDGLTAGRPHGSVTVRFWADLPNVDVMSWGSRAHFRIRIERALIADHCLLQASAGTCAGFDTSWFARNQWQRNFYYAVAQNNTANVLPAVGGCNSSNCLRFNDSATRNIRLLLVLAGRRLDTQARPSASLANYLEFQNADLGTMYEQRPMRMSKVSMSPLADPFFAPWNDRVILVDWDPGSPPNAAQVVSMTPLRVVVALP